MGRRTEMSHLEDTVDEQYRLSELFTELNERIKRRGVVATSVLHTRYLPPRIAERVAQPYRDLGWKVVFTPGLEATNKTCFVFIK